MEKEFLDKVQQAWAKATCAEKLKAFDDAQKQRVLQLKKLRKEEQEALADKAAEKQEVIFQNCPYSKVLHCRKGHSIMIGDIV